MPSYARPALAVLAAVSVALAALTMWGFDSPTAAGFTFRVGVLLGALWFAWPEIIQRSGRRMLLFAAAGAALILRPRAAWVLIPAFLVWLAMARR